MKQNYFEVCVRSATYNHAPYIVDTLNGFTMQETNFPYVCCIIDDASTDGEPEIIRKYLQENFELEEESVVRNEETDDYVLCFAQHKTNKNCYFAVLWLKYNHYSLNKKKWQYIAEWNDNAQYIAICEGDDYWIHPRKLQMQFNYMTNHTECTMTCHRAQLYSEKKKKIIGEQYCRISDGVLNPIDVINRTGLYIPTCSLMFKPSIMDNYPEYCRNCNVGDYPLQIMAAMKGKIYYFNEIMSVYRIDNPMSWVGKQKFKSIDPSRLFIVRSQMEMFIGFADSYPQYKKIYTNKIAEHIIKNMPFGDRPDSIQCYVGLFGNEIKNFDLRWKFIMMIYRSPAIYLRKKFSRMFLKKYMPLRMIY